MSSSLVEGDKAIHRREREVRNLMPTFSVFSKNRTAQKKIHLSGKNKYLYTRIADCRSF